MLGEKDSTVADPSATDIPHQITAVVTNECTFRLWGAMSGPPRVWGTTKMLLPSSYCKWRKVPRCLWTSLSTTTPSRSTRWWSRLATTTSRWTRSPTCRRRPSILRPTRGRWSCKTKTRTKLHYIVRLTLLCNLYLQSLS